MKLMRKSKEKIFIDALKRFRILKSIKNLSLRTNKLNNKIDKISNDVEELQKCLP